MCYTFPRPFHSQNVNNVNDFQTCDVFVADTFDTVGFLYTLCSKPECISDKQNNTFFSYSLHMHTTFIPLRQMQWRLEVQFISPTRYGIRPSLMRSLYHIVFQTYIQFVCSKTLLTDLVMAGVMVAEGMLFSGSRFNFNLVLTFWYCYAIRFWNGFWRLSAT